MRKFWENLLLCEALQELVAQVFLISIQMHFRTRKIINTTSYHAYTCILMYSLFCLLHVAIKITHTAAAEKGKVKINVNKFLELVQVSFWWLLWFSCYFIFVCWLVVAVAIFFFFNLFIFKCQSVPLNHHFTGLHKLNISAVENGVVEEIIVTWKNSMNTNWTLHNTITSIIY